MKIVITGSSGFVGSNLATYFDQLGYELVLLSRKIQDGRSHYWNPDTNELNPSLLEGADVVINLSGENIFGRWNEQKKEAIRDSRLRAARLLCDALLRCKVLPSLYIGASAVGFYGDRKEEILDEQSAAGHGFLPSVCKSWEDSSALLAQKTRVCIARFGIVLGKNGGALTLIEKAFRTGLGGALGSGKQMMSWIAMDDVLGAIQHVISHQELSGPINFVSPLAVSNATFTEILGIVLNRPTVLNVPKFALSMFFGEGAEVLLASTHVAPRKLLDSGYTFQYPELEPALRKYLSI